MVRLTPAQTRTTSSFSTAILDTCVTANTSAAVLGSAMPQISSAASKQPLPCLCPASLICVVKWKQNLSSHYFQYSNGFLKPTSSHTVSKEKPLNQPVGALAAPHSLPGCSPDCIVRTCPRSALLAHLPGKRDPLSHLCVPWGLTGLLDHCVLPTL